jgi:tricorn protease interacting factor F2/3
MTRVSHGYTTIMASAVGLSGKGEYALEQAARCLDFFAKYYEVPYPLPKLHLVAVPRFLSGAMENWGAIASSEPFLLIQDRTSMSTRQSLTSLIAHEVAHQWFGNLVTMRTWDDLWLNESFATFADFKALEALFPEWESWNDFLILEYSTGLLFDSLPTSHPVHVEVTDPERIGEFFDEISYSKGASVLRMIEAYVGPENFRRGVSQYLREHQWANAEARDLWGALSQSSREPVERVMTEWLGRPGFPVVRARVEDGSVLLEQSRFSLLGSMPDAPWPIPLTYSADGQVGRRLFSEAKTVLPERGVRRLLVGPGRTGFYRVRYEGRLWTELLESYSDLPPTDRWGMLNDALPFFLAGEIELSEYLDLLGRAEHDSAPLVVNEVYDSFEFASCLAHRIPRWEAAYRKIFSAQTERLGIRSVPGEPDAYRALRERVHRARIPLDPEFARSLATSFDRLDAADPEMVGPIQMAYASTAGPDEYARLRQRLRTLPPGLEIRDTAGALALLPRADWLGESLDLLRSGELELGHWTRLFYLACRYNPERSGAVWSFLTERLSGCAALMDSGTFGMGYLLRYAIPMVGVGREDAMRRWVTEHPLPGAGEANKTGLSLLEVFARTLRRNA